MPVAAFQVKHAESEGSERARVERALSDAQAQERARFAERIAEAAEELRREALRRSAFRRATSQLLLVAF